MGTQRRRAGHSRRSWDDWAGRREPGEPLREGLKTLFGPVAETATAPPDDGGASARELATALERLTAVVDRLEQLPERTGEQVERRLRALHRNGQGEGAVAAAHLLLVPSS